MKNPDEIIELNYIKEDNLVEVRCPLSNVSKSDNKIYKCNRVCVEVLPGSAGRSRCRSCRSYFLFEVSKEAQASTGIRVQKVE